LIFCAIIRVKERDLVQQVITIARKKYASGLFWQPVAGGQNPRSFARKIAKFVPGRIKYFTEYHGMVGIGSFALGHRRAMPIAAAEIMESFSEYNSFLGVFAVKQGSYLLAVRNGIIIADRLHASEDAAHAEYNKLSELPDWGTLIAPGNWAAPRAEEKHLEDVVSGETKVVAQSVSGFGKWMVTLVLLLIAAGIGGYLLKNPIMGMLSMHANPEKVDQLAAEKYRKSMEERAAMVKNNLPAPARLSMPYDALPDPVLRMRQCYDAITYLMQIIPGWNQVDATCDNTTATAHLHRSWGAMTDVLNFVKANMSDVTITENSDSDIVLTLDLVTLPTAARPPVMSASDVSRNVNSTFQLMGQTVDARPGVETVAGPNNTTAAVNLVLASAASKLVPLEFIKIFADYSAVAVPSVGWTARDRTWNYEVKIYVK